MIRLTTTIAVVALSFLASPASAVVYCKDVGVPKGCVERAPAGAEAARARAVTPHVGVEEPRVGVETPKVGVDEHRVGVGAPGAGVEAGNRGGPVDRAGRR